MTHTSICISGMVRRLPSRRAAIFLYIFLPFVLLLNVKTVRAQGDLPPDENTELYYRLLQISGIADDPRSFSLRPIAPVSEFSGEHPWQDRFHTEPQAVMDLPFRGGIYLYAPEWYQSFNSTLPRGGNDGALWQGRGYNTSGSVGFLAKTGPLEIRFRPEFGFSQNKSFDLGPYPVLTIGTMDYRDLASIYAYRHTDKIDYVQRFGDSAYQWFDWGDSSIELRKWSLRLALSNRQLWVGPAVQSALQFGYNAPGFRHLYAGSAKPIESQIGSFEFAYVFGGIRKSDYFAKLAEEMLSVNSLVFIYSPWFDQNLSLGIHRSYYHDFPNSFSEYRDQVRKLVDPGVKSALATEENQDIVDTDNQVLSFFMRYMFPESGFEFYSEYGRNDANADNRDLRLQPDHFRAYLLGALKNFQLSRNRILAVGLEFVQLETPRPSLLRGGGALIGWYTHFHQNLGLTNSGQIMGSGLGPSGNSQLLYAKLYDHRGKLGFKLERITHNNSAVDQYFARIEEVNQDEIDHWMVRNIEYMIGLELNAFLPKNFEVGVSLDQSFIMNHQYLKKNDLFNTRFSITIRKQNIGWLR